MYRFRWLHTSNWQSEISWTTPCWRQMLKVHLTLCLRCYPSNPGYLWSKTESHFSTDRMENTDESQCSQTEVFSAEERSMLSCFCLMRGRQTQPRTSRCALRNVRFESTVIRVSTICSGVPRGGLKFSAACSRVSRQAILRTAADSSRLFSHRNILCPEVCPSHEDYPDRNARV